MANQKDPTEDAVTLEADVGDLIARAIGRDPEALERLVDSYLPAIEAFVRRNTNGFLKERESCSDLVQSACKDVIERIDLCEFRSVDSFRSWLYLLVLNKIRMHERYYRAGKRTPPSDAGEYAAAQGAGSAARLVEDCGVTSASSEAVRREELERLDAALNRLPPHYRQAITLSKFVGLSFEEIGARMNREPEAVRSLTRRAIVVLSREMGPTETTG